MKGVYVNDDVTDVSTDGVTIDPTTQLNS